MSADNDKVYFRWMGAYWVCSPEVWKYIKRASDRFRAIELNDQVLLLGTRLDTVQYLRLRSW